MIYYLSLGSNMGDKSANLQEAVAFLEGVGDILKISSIYETEPVGMDTAGEVEDFYNLVLGLRTKLSPSALLAQIKAFEKQMGRDIVHSHNLPRTIDIDILLAGDRMVNTKHLTIPHKEMTKRAFVLIPLNEIAPEVIHPVLKKPVKELLSDYENSREGAKTRRKDFF